MGIEVTDVTEAAGTAIEVAGTADGAGRLAAVGVVDKDCKVFSVPNLYIAGSSVYATGGYANPTLMIVQLSARLADHLTAT